MRMENMDADVHAEKTMTATCHWEWDFVVEHNYLWS